VVNIFEKSTVRTHIPKDDTQVDVVEEFDLGVFVGQPEWNRYNESKQIANCDPLVASTNGEHITSNGPSDGKGIILLDILAGPDIRSLNRCKDLELVSNNSFHHDIVEDGPDDSSHHLGGKCTLGRQVHQLSNFEITAEPLSLLDTVESKDSEVHICLDNPRVSISQLEVSTCHIL
jgi:hypothetical protein